MDPQDLEELRRKIAELNESFEKLGNTGQLLDEDLAKLQSLFGRQQRAKREEIKASNVAGQALGNMANALVNTTSQIYRGQRGMKVMADGLDQMATAVQTAIAVFTTLVPAGRALGIGAKLLLNGTALAGKALTTYAKFTAEQSDKLFSTYQNLSRIGAAGTDLEGVFENLQRMGLTVEEIEKYTQIITKQKDYLLSFGASAAEGARNLSAISGAIVKSDLGRQLEMMGLTVEDITSSTATYMIMQNRLGRLQYKSAEEVARESAKFALELDKMARFTATSREEQEEQRKSAIEDERYAAFQLTAAGQGVNIEAFEQFLTGMDEERARAYRHLIAGRGAPTSEEARRLLQSEGPQAYQRAMGVARGEISPIEARAAADRAGLEFARRFSEQAAIGATEGFGLRIGGRRGYLEQGRQRQLQEEEARRLLQSEGPQAYQRAMGVARGEISPIEARAAADRAGLEFARRFSEQAAIGATEGFGLRIGGRRGYLEQGRQRQLQEEEARRRGITIEQLIEEEAARARLAEGEKAAQVDTRRAQMSAAQSLDGFVRLGVKPATTALETFASGLDKATRALPGSPYGGRPTTGGGGAAPAGGGGGGTATGGAGSSLRNIREMIARVESGGNYNILAGGDQANLTSMTVREVLDLQKQRIGQGKPQAAGKYQIQRATLLDAMAKAGIGLDAKFDEATQDRLADALIMRRGFEQYQKSGTPDAKARFLANLAQEWRGLPNAPDTRAGAATDKYGNKAGMDWQTAIESFQVGGIFSKREGLAMLHGPEAIVPLPDGRSIPVSLGKDLQTMIEQVQRAALDPQTVAQLTNAVSEMSQRMNQPAGGPQSNTILSSQLEKLDELVRAMQNQVNISSKILQHTRQ